MKFLPDILRACGYYPSEKEVEEMSNEVLFWKYGIGEVDEIQAEITLEDVVKLYVNYQHVHEDGRMVDQEEELINAIDGLETDQTKDIQAGSGWDFTSFLFFEFFVIFCDFYDFLWFFAVFLRFFALFYDFVRLFHDFTIICDVAPPQPAVSI